MNRSHLGGAVAVAAVLALLLAGCVADPYGVGPDPLDSDLAGDDDPLDDAAAPGDEPSDGAAAQADADLGAEAACVRTIDVTSSGTLASALSGAQPGDCIVLADATYSFPTIKKKGTAASPIVVRALNRGKAKVTSGNLVLDGAAHVTVEGLHWASNGNVRISNAESCRISRFTFRPQEAQDRDWISVSGKSDHTRIDHNDLGPQSKLANMIMLSGSGGKIVKNTRIDHNYFHDIHNTGGNGWEAIRAGLSGLAPSSGNTVIEHNLFERCDGDPEIISIKSSDAVVRYNTLRANHGEITLRHGNRTQVHGNFILGEKVPGSGGIRVLGADHKIFNNYIQDVTGRGIFLEGGSADGENENGTAHYRVYRAQVVYNTIVGSKGIANGGAHPLGPVDSVIADNIVEGPSGQLYKQQDAVNPTYQGNIANPTGGTSIGMTVPASQITRVNPKLSGGSGVRRLTSGSPAVDKGVGSFTYVTHDLDGEARSTPDVGADELTDQTPTRRPLLPADVGPDAP